MERGTSEMRVEILADADAVAGRAAALVAREAHDALVRRGRFVLALSGGRTPERFWRALARETVPWDRVDLVQVDERVAARDDPDRNWTGLERRLVAPASLPPERTHPMPVEAVDLAAAARSYADLLARLAGTPPCSTWCSSASAPTGTPRRSCRATRCCGCGTPTWRRPAPMRDGAA